MSRLPPVAAAVCWLLAAALAGADAGPDLPAAILRELAAADAARASEAGERQAWDLEAQRLRLLADRLDDELRQRQAEAAAHQQQLAARRDELIAVAGERGQLDDLRNQLAERSLALRAALAGLARRHVPGAVAEAGEEASVEADFDAVVQALERSRRAAGEVAVDIIEGRRDGAPRAVTMLRIAGLGWWCDFAGDDAGWVRPAAGPPRLESCPDAGDRAAIRAAVAIAEGRQRPAVVRLPLAPEAP